MPKGTKYTDTLEMRFWPKVQKTEGCWLWLASWTADGYGQIKFKGKRMYAHHVSVRLSGREIPPGMVICHHCDTPKCVRPDHLFVGTMQENQKDSVRKGRNYAPGRFYKRKGNTAVLKSHSVVYGSSFTVKA